MTEDGKQAEIFYASLFPSKIKSYLDKADKKQNRKAINITFNGLKKDADELYIVVKQFSHESRRQGFGSGEIVQNTITLKDMDKLTSLTATAVGVRNEFEFLQRLSTGDICFYGTTDDNKIKVPLAWDEYCKHYISRQVTQQVIVGEEVFYNEYEVIISSDKKIDIILSENLEVDLENSKFTLNFKTDLKQVKKDARFILCLLKNRELKIGNKSIKYEHFDISEEFKKSLLFTVTLGDILDEIEYEYTFSINTLNIVEQKQLALLVSLKNGERNTLLTDKVHTFDWIIDGKFMPLLIIKGDDGSINLCNAIYTKKVQTSIKNANGEHYKTPLFSNLKPKVLANLCYYNYNCFYDQINKSDINENTTDYLNDTVLRLIQAYDINNDKNLLDIAEYILDKIIYIEEKIYYILNKMQIKKRKGEFEDNEKQVLNNIQGGNILELFGISVLLGNEKQATLYLEQMNEKESRWIVDFPIYRLYQNLLSQIQ